MQLVNDLVKFCHKVYEKEFVSAYDGNLSLRTKQNTILITRSAVCKGDVTPEDILEIDLSGKLISGQGKITTEVKIHLLAYQHRTDINAVVHTHPPFATAFAAIGERIDRPVFPEVILSLGKIPLCKYGTPSTNELPDSMKPHIDYAWAMLLENHGAVTFGKNIEDAYYKTEKLEHAAKTLFIARALGREKALPHTKLRELYNIASSVYGISVDRKNRLDY
ncbi:MAG: class II aldolase/adducin family protein [Ignavibacteria bacterium]|nr:MAG: class II aldolase/adducin family protein [Ignavibacteria bacterium]